MSFEITENKGFKITFPNGCTLSTQFGPGNYGSNYGERIFDNIKRREGWEATQVEIAVWDKDHNWITKEILDDPSNDVKGYVDINEWLEIFDKARNYKPQ